ncbi:unnamed protein product (macronuclear) [Paramecium tetraurelia]|uniref:glutathione transferase n=1 Tax=Paramecium tetraurelia TaxID=5888 RepID=A0BG54_PARTE|nr:uncharacterized protein GSPATT00028556001 [Paramecium tetraurelia]CAK57521.1 unnamed protein product [Paramecium tetraurelia]|eukprot:XP_001424919.1 hypothetical protein (macronuclear) [Paramecium tetraurelia strain d4-2]
MADQLVLGYWGIRGLAQPLRYLVEYLGLPYEEKRYLKPEEWFGGLCQAPFNTHVLVNLPYIKDGEKYVYESAALYVYLAHKANRPDLLGSTPDEQVAVAQVRGVIQDALKGFFHLITLPEDQYAAKKEEVYANEVAWLIERLDKFIDGKTWAAGANLTYIDFGLFELEETLKAFHPESWAKFANLQKHHQEFSNIPQIKEYQASGRFLAGPFYPPGRFRWGF